MCENWDKEVRADMKMILDKIVPEVGSLYIYIYKQAFLPVFVRSSVKSSLFSFGQLSITILLTTNLLKLEWWLR